MTETYQPPKTTPLYHLLPSEPLLLMGAGPVPIPHAVAQANSVVINHLGDTMNQVLERVKLMGKYAFQTSISLTVATFFFAFQIYCDFNGYSSIAIGIGKVLGFDFGLNSTSVISKQLICL